MIRIDRLDHLVLTVASIEDTARFYETVLGMRRVTFKGGRTALRFGQQKINLHQAGHEFEPKSRVPTPGSGDLCFISPTPMDQMLEHLRDCGVTVEEGPVERSGAEHPIRSVYFRDPDGNLVEVSNIIGDAA